jgi:predicted nucleic acid-binding protein
MNDRVFIDTNVLVYAFDDHSKKKQKRAWALLDDGEFRPIISTQVLQEFYSVVTRKLQRPMKQPQAKEALVALSRLPTVQVDTPMVIAAAETSDKERISFWDALIIQAALEGCCTRLLTEDLQSDRDFGGLKIENPF